MNMEEEVRAWSDGVLRTLFEEEDLSPQFRELVGRELSSRLAIPGITSLRR